MSDFDERPAAEILAELAKYDSADLIKAAQAARTPITAEMLGKIVSPVLRQYGQEFRTKIADLETRIDNLEQQNAKLRASRPVRSDHSVRIARLEREMEEAENGGD